MLSNSSLSSLAGGEFDFSDHSTDTSQTDDLISFTSNDFSIEPNDEMADRPDMIENTDMKEIDANYCSTVDKNIVSKKIYNVPEYRVRF